MPFPANIVANADDLGLNVSVNQAILQCFKYSYINSASLLTNTPGFEEAVQLIHQNPCMINIGIHVNLAEGCPLTKVNPNFLTADGNWDLQKTGKLLNILSARDKQGILQEIHAQVDRAVSHNVPVSHIDSHHHLHTIPALNNLFLQVAQHYNLRLRLAQTYREGSYPKFWYRKFINRKLISRRLKYSDYFETVEYFLSNKHAYPNSKITEIMLHPDLDAEGKLTDHYDAATMTKWLKYLNG